MPFDAAFAASHISPFHTYVTSRYVIIAVIVAATMLDCFRHFIAIDCSPPSSFICRHASIRQPTAYFIARLHTS